MDDDVFAELMESMLQDMAAWAIRYDPDTERFLARVQQKLDDAGGSLSPEEARKRAITIQVIALLLWHRLPLPSRGFRSAPLRQPGRNEPCICGSGRKVKHCCGPFLRELRKLHLPDELAAQVMLDAAPVRILRQAHEHLSHELLAAIAADWLENDKAERALALLEPIAERDDAALSRKSAAAINVLYNLYDDLDMPRKKARLVQRMRRHPDRTLRSDACQRHAIILSDRGDDEGAWNAFLEARKLTPDDPSLAVLELLLLFQRGEFNRMRQRGVFWLKRLERMNRNGELDDLIDRVRALMNEPEAVMIAGHPDRESDVQRLLDILHHHPAPALPLERPKAQGDVLVMVPVDDRARTLLKDWEKAVIDCEDMWADTGWLTLLERHPELLGSFVVLDDVLEAIRQLDSANTVALEDIVARLSLPLIVEAVPTDPELPMPWSFLENRPVLRLMELQTGIQDEKSEPYVEWLEWMLALNPVDNQGAREWLMGSYLRLGRYQEAVRLGECYPEDILVAIPFGHALALFALGRKEEASRRLKQAIQDSPKVAKALLANRMRKPKLHPGGVMLGGDDEAWLYRQTARDLWRSVPGAMEWLKEKAGDV